MNESELRILSTVMPAVGAARHSPVRRRLLLAALAVAVAGPLQAAETVPVGASRLWLDESGRVLPQARAALSLLADASSHGLVPQDYDAAGLARTLAHPLASPREADAADQALTRAFERYLSELHRGRVDPASLRHDFQPARADPFDAAQALRLALERQDLAAAVAAAVPQLPLYGHLRVALARYRQLAGHPAWASPLPPLPRAPKSRSAKLEPGQHWAGLELLAQRLRALGDLAPADPLPGTVAAPASLPPPAASEASRYEGELVEAVRRFQLRHGLETDGVIGATTWTQLGIDPAARARQIELALERLRWTPLLRSRRMVVVNLPEFVLRAYEVADDGRVQLALESRVVVGRALDTRTPLFDADMRFIEFSPYWNIPPSIARSETVPKLRRDPGYFDRMGLEFVHPDGRVDQGLSSARLDAVLAGGLRIRQRPGERNALGDIKFVFPNADNIYLHHTPAVDLFGRARRDYSHGCIRVEKPVELAEFVLRGMPGWDRARIQAAMAQGKSNTLRLAEPVPVLLSYGTTLVKGAQIFFFNDIYGHDRVLAQALQQRSLRRIE
ncbi:MAG: hypothetical protein RLZZ22_1284 [Pseudomonadota bacterium]